ncbi:hypothetical protein ABE28_019960 [Peribacillus muralis]|uniref:Uncharacterized protein n=1 Tax=Peribacillus muralis TaxID=264697 RepID=A0A1B3XTV4_9BACI|nr:hypothetical protein ABE28_019960 [Peribacillus muralis]
MTGGGWEYGHNDGRGFRSEVNIVVRREASLKEAKQAQHILPRMQEFVMSQARLNGSPIGMGTECFSEHCRQDKED